MKLKTQTLSNTQNIFLKRETGYEFLELEGLNLGNSNFSCENMQAKAGNKEFKACVGNFLRNYCGPAEQSYGDAAKLAI